MKSHPTKFNSFLRTIVQMGTLQKSQKTIQTLPPPPPSIFGLTTESLFWVIIVEVQFCHFPPPNTYIHGKDSKI